MRLVKGRQAERVVARLAERKATISKSVERRAAKIVSGVRNGGDAALRRYARRFDQLKDSEALRVSQAELDEAADSIPVGLREALLAAANNIRRFCQWQSPKEWHKEMLPGVHVGQVVRPIAAVGCYVPGGRYPLPSSLLMTVIPAQVAGVARIVVASPRPAKEVLAAAKLLGVSEFYRVGGAQAVAALAYGTESIPRVLKIVGPGNAFVTAAKKQVAFDCGIDFLAGPTETLVLIEKGNPSFIAADLVAQAEHDADACSLFVTTSEALAKRVVVAAAKMARGNAVAEKALRKNGYAIVMESAEKAMEAANRIAPEHITVPPEMVARVQNAGSIFCGDYSAQAVGDYLSGPNHVLPTGAGALTRGGLSVMDYVKVITVQQLEASGLKRIARQVESLAVAEGLTAHAASVQVRRTYA